MKIEFLNRGRIVQLVLFLLLFCYNKVDAQCTTCPKFNHVYLSVKDIQASVQFYTKAFDLKITDSFNLLNISTSDTAFKKPVKVIFLKFPGQDFVYELAQRADKNDSISKPGNLLQHVGVEVNDISTALTRVTSAGGKIAIAIRSVLTNSGLEIKQAYVKGPDDETIELTEIVKGGY